MQNLIEGKLAVNVSGDWKTWDSQTGAYSKSVDVASNPTRYPIAETEVISIMAACALAGDSVSMVYPPIGPYTAGLIRLFDATDATDREDAGSIHCPPEGCDFSLRVEQGNTITVYILPAAARSTDPYSSASLTTAAINLRNQDGELMRVALLATPNVQTDGLPNDPEVLHVWLADNTPPQSPPPPLPPSPPLRARLCCNPRAKPCSSSIEDSTRSRTRPTEARSDLARLAFPPWERASPSDLAAGGWTGGPRTASAWPAAAVATRCTSTTSLCRTS